MAMPKLLGAIMENSLPFRITLFRVVLLIFVNSIQIFQ